jgi:hypothetical protein
MPLPSRSYIPITRGDLARLAALADTDRQDFFKRNPGTRHLYADRLFAVALCQGAALHYLDGINGIKDLDVWSFYDQHPQRQYPPRRIAQVDFGDPKFGTSDDSPQFAGRRVDLIGRSIRDTSGHGGHAEFYAAASRVFWRRPARFPTSTKAFRASGRFSPHPWRPCAATAQLQQRNLVLDVSS